MRKTKMCFDFGFGIALFLLLCSVLSSLSLCVCMYPFDMVCIFCFSIIFISLFHVQRLVYVRIEEISNSIYMSIASETQTKTEN